MMSFINTVQSVSHNKFGGYFEVFLLDVDLFTFETLKRSVLLLLHQQAGCSSNTGTNLKKMNMLVK